MAPDILVNAGFKMACSLAAPSHYLNQYLLILSWNFENKFHEIVCIFQVSFDKSIMT